MRYQFLKPITIVNVLLVAIVLAIHAVAFATIVYSQRPQPITEEGAEAISMNIFALNMAGDDPIDAIEMAVESPEEELPQITKAEAIEEPLITTKSLDINNQPKVLKAETEEKKTPSKNNQAQKTPPKKQKIVQKKVVKKNTPVGDYVSKASSRGGTPMLSKNQFKFIYNPKPTYPRSAKKRGLSGSAVVLVTFNERGLVSRVKLEQSSGVKSLDQAAVATANKVKVHPYIQDGRATTFNHKITYDFSTY